MPRLQFNFGEGGASVNGAENPSMYLYKNKVHSRYLALVIVMKLEKGSTRVWFG